VICGRFAYAAPRSLDEAVSLLADDPEGAKLLGGGTWAVPELNRGESRARLVIDLRRAGLGGVESAGDRVRVGATCTYSELLASPEVEERLPLLRLMASGVTGGRQIQNQGTLGGSVAAARPQSDAPAAVVALGGKAVVAGPGGERRCSPGELFAGPMRTALAPGEILAGFDFPAADGLAYGYVKVKRSSSSWPIATAACLLDLGEDGTCRAATLVLGAVSPVPLPIDLQEVLVGKRLSEVALDAAAQAAAVALDEPWSDVLAPAEYRAAVAPVVARRALASAWAHWLAGGGA
jgi:carbon-monoxide dehydrogenase medium subunit